MGTSAKKKERKRKDLKAFEDRKAFLKDENRTEAVKKRHDKGNLTARENIANLCDEGSFIEYGSLIVAGQRTKKSLEDLIEKTPADGLVGGTGNVNGEQFSEEASKCMVISYDYMVLAGTQGAMNHKKTDRLFQIADRAKLPIIFYLEGGGGRPGDVDFMPITVGGLTLNTFSHFAKLSGKMPRIAIVNGNCFAGNAALAGVCDVIIATKSTSIGMGGPAMIEGGGLGVFKPEDVGPISFQVPNGVIDLLANDEKHATQLAKQYLSYFQGSIDYTECDEQIKLRDIVPEERKMAYNMRKVINGLCDKSSVLELRENFGRSMITALVRINGRPMGLIANNLQHLGGALDSDACDKTARFIKLCDSFGLPIVSLIDAPGFMVGPEAEQAALVRHSGRLFLAGAHAKVPIYSIITRRAYGLGAMALAGGDFFASQYTVSWPSGELGAMGLEGAVKLGFKKDLEGAKDDDQREALFKMLVAGAYQQGSALNAASLLEIDEVIDPADTRKWIINANAAFPEQSYKTREGGYVDSW